MPSVSLEKMQQDHLAMSIARALALANETALAQGIKPEDSSMTITEEVSLGARHWRIHYGPRDYINRRGGDLIVLVDEGGEAVQRIIRGQ